MECRTTAIPETAVFAALRRTCAVCGSVLRTRYKGVKERETGKTFSIETCSSCGLGHTQPVPLDMSEYYPATYCGGRHGFLSGYCAWRRINWVEKLAGKRAGKTLIDVGCGDGTFLLLARKRGWKVAGTEINPEIARQAGLIIQTDLTGLAEMGSVDCITMWHSLEHLNDPISTLRSAVRLLRLGGFLVIAVPDAGGLQAAAFGRNWFHLDVPRHLYHFTHLSMLRLTENSGLKIVKSWHQEFEYDTLGWSQSALNRWSSTSNVFFDSLRRRPRQNISRRVIHNACGILLSFCALPLVGLGAILRRGGTLIIAAQKNGA